MSRAGRRITSALPLSLRLAVSRSKAGASLEQHSAISCLEQEIWCSVLPSFLDFSVDFFLLFLSLLHLKSGFISVTIKHVRHFHMQSLLAGISSFRRTVLLVLRFGHNSSGAKS